jgi:hypothetical protein
MADYHYCNRIDRFVAAQYLKPFFLPASRLVFLVFPNNGSVAIPLIEQFSSQF